VFALPDLEELDLYGNEIRIVPDRIRNLGKLKVLDLQRNPIETAPDIPGLSLDWRSYHRCRHTLSPSNLIGRAIETGEDQEHHGPIPHENQILPAISELPNLRRLGIGLRSPLLQRPLAVPEPQRTVKRLIDKIGELSQLRVSKYLWNITP
jgi:Leucine-rich repeat (LRR) protein